MTRTVSKQRPLRPLLTAVGLVFVVCALLVGAVMLTGTQVDGGTLAFTVMPPMSAVSQIYLLDVSTGVMLQLTDTEVDLSTDPQWTMDGTHIAFNDLTPTPSGEVFALSDVYMLSMEDMALHNVTNSNESVGRFDLSPDGAYIAYEYARDIYLTDRQGQTVQSLTNSFENDLSPAWSPNGFEIAYVANRDDAQEAYSLFLTDTDGLGSRNLTPNSVEVYHPTWSPDGTRLAYLVSYGGFELMLSVIDLSNGEVVDLSPAALVGGDSYFSWSPDGSHLVFVNAPDGNVDLYVARADGSSTYRLTTHSELDVEPSWSPDRRHVAFVSARDGHGELYLINIETRQLRRLTFNEDREANPTWRPEVNR